MLYYKRWTIEKAFNNSKSDLKVKKAWSSDDVSLGNQMRFSAMTYNIMRILEEKSKLEQPEMIHSSDNKYTKALLKKDEEAKKEGRSVNPLHFRKRLTRICSFTIREVQKAILSGMLYCDLMNKLVGKLISHPAQ